LARDLAHSRPHLDSEKQPKDAIEAFESKGLKATKALSALPDTRAEARIELGDARHLPLAKGSVDLVITSPPYANAIDYQRAHKFSLVWLGYPIRKLQSMRSSYIGTESINGFSGKKLPELVENALTRIAAKDSKRSKVIRQYFVDMRGTVLEIERVLAGGAPAVIVVGDSTVRGQTVPTGECLQQIATDVGLVTAGTAKREIDRDKRLLPFSRVRNGKGIESRMHQEFILAFASP